MRASRRAFAALLILVFVGAGCYESLTSIVTKDKLVFYEDLLGTYKPAEPATGRITLGKGEGKSYTQTHYDEKGVQTNKGSLHILKLGDHHFYEIAIDDFKNKDGKPIYVIGRLEMEGKEGARTLTGYGFESKDKFFAEAGIATAEYEHKDEGETRKGRALSMPPDVLQAYLAAHAKEMTHQELRLERAGRPVLGGRSTGARVGRWGLSNPISFTSPCNCWWMSCHSRIRTNERKFVWQSLRSLLVDRCPAWRW